MYNEAPFSDCFLETFVFSGGS